MSGRDKASSVIGWEALNVEAYVEGNDAINDSVDSMLLLWAFSNERADDCEWTEGGLCKRPRGDITLNLHPFL